LGGQKRLAGESIAQGADIVKRSFRNVYDYLGMTMVMSAAWFLIGFFPSALTFLVMIQVPAINSFLIFAVVSSLLLGPVTAATYSLASAMVQGEYVTLRDYWARFVKHYKRSVGLTAAMLGVLAILVVDLIFFMNSQVAWMQYLSVLWVYFLIFWALMAQYVYVALVRQDRKVWEAMKVAALLALDNIVASLMVAITGALVIAVSVWMRVPLLLFLAGTLAFLHCTAFEIIVGKYRDKSEPAGSGEGEREKTDG
jgi:Predicted integral membrane protein